tara:strand:- start:592 stop:771 length:180 start_codon:yes stop_codon:yes gene_type:complete
MSTQRINSLTEQHKQLHERVAQLEKQPYDCFNNISGLKKEELALKNELDLLIAKFGMEK